MIISGWVFKFAQSSAVSEFKSATAWLLLHILFDFLLWKSMIYWKQIWSTLLNNNGALLIMVKPQPWKALFSKWTDGLGWSNWNWILIQSMERENKFCFLYSKLVSNNYWSNWGPNIDWRHVQHFKWLKWCSQQKFWRTCCQLGQLAKQLLLFRTER